MRIVSFEYISFPLAQLLAASRRTPLVFHQATLSRTKNIERRLLSVNTNRLPSICLIELIKIYILSAKKYRHQSKLYLVSVNITNYAIQIAASRTAASHSFAFSSLSSSSFLQFLCIWFILTFAGEI